MFWPVARVAGAAALGYLAPALATVTLNAEFGASILQIPRWSVFGGYEHRLVIGLPLLAALTVDEFTALLVHEMGHAAGDQGPFSAWIYRLRTTWAAVQRKFAEPTALVAHREERGAALSAVLGHAACVQGRAEAVGAARMAARRTRALCGRRRYASEPG